MNRPRDGTDAAPSSAPEPHCRNCGAVAVGAYCPACGQETAVTLPTARQFLRDAAGRYVALDGRLWRTLAALLFRPGFLTREYFAGRRRRYIRPGRLFLVLSLAVFAMLQLVAGVPGAIEAELAAEVAQPKESVAGDGARGKDDATIDAGLFGIRVGEDMRFRVEGEDNALKREVGRRLERFNRLPLDERVDRLIAGVFRYGPYAMVALLPAYALLLQLVYLGRTRRYPGRPRRYAEHMVFGAHNHAFLFLALLLMAIPFAPLHGVLAVWVVAYFLWSMKVVYRGRWSGILLRAFVVQVGYGILFALALVGLFLAALLLK
jgi:hypothetical protein